MDRYCPECGNEMSYMGTDEKQLDTDGDSYYIHTRNWWWCPDCDEHEYQIIEVIEKEYED